MCDKSLILATTLTLAALWALPATLATAATAPDKTPPASTATPANAAAPGHGRPTMSPAERELQRRGIEVIQDVTRRRQQEAEEKARPKPNSGTDAAGNPP